MARWSTPFSSRELYRDGVHVVTINRAGNSSDGFPLSPAECDDLARRIAYALQDSEPKPEYRVTTVDVCVPGNERLRNRSEFILLASVIPSTTAADIRGQLLADIQSCDRGDWFDYDSARAAVESAMADYVRPAFRRKRWNPFDVPRVRPDDCEPGCYLYVYVDSGEESV
jgi:hypothetical protein